MNSKLESGLGRIHKPEIRRTDHEALHKHTPGMVQHHRATTSDVINELLIAGQSKPSLITVKHYGQRVEDIERSNPGLKVPTSVVHIDFTKQ